MYRLESKKEKNYNPPECPCCGIPLYTVSEELYEAYRFNPETGEYELEVNTSVLVVRCPSCEADLSEFFEEGACNFVVQAS